MSHMKIIEAINRLVPMAKVTLVDDKIIWEDERPQPSMEDISLEIEKNNYSYLRKDEYPKIEDQLDILYHEGYEGWKNTISEIKDKYPKP